MQQNVSLKNFVFKILVFCQLQEYNVVSLYPKNHSSISYGFFNTVFVTKNKLFLPNLLSARLHCR